MSQESGGPGFGLGRMRFGLPRPTKAVAWLIGLCAAAFVVQALAEDVKTLAISGRLGVTVHAFWQVWRYATFQFLHAGPQHLILNMLGLYFFGTMLEGIWGWKRFTAFYLVCGAAAGGAYAAISGLLGGPGAASRPIIGASGGVYGTLLACAVLVPHAKVILIVFPMSVRTAAICIFGVMILIVAGSVSRAVGGRAPSSRAMSEVAHLGGAVAAAVWMWVLPGRRLTSPLGRLRTRLGRGAWEKKIRRREQERAEVDRILDKVRRDGIASLSDRERRVLQDATRRQQEEDRWTTKL